LEKVVVSLEEINYLIKKKIDSNKINSIPSYDQKAISYKITVDDQDFTLKLKQAKSYTLKTEIYFIKKYFQNISLTIFLPKDEGSSYDTDDKILAAIKKKLFKTIETVSAKTINE
jgi:biopolymer transport protein ExbD